ncbi:hypothetical protein AKJ09_05627 [Labilithrix luteola]|uniref:Glycosyltransferase RgtA/B/C/D-like domain-containing protein n=1 Tax=Labilithrix luteola TaxID=1391654 RepID=A0A0K1PZL0_9BACT|nr:hypothetical protein AKJ09_05627 [Labilithrix luteola]
MGEGPPSLALAWGKWAFFGLVLVQALLLELRTPCLATPFESDLGDSAVLGRLPAAAWAIVGLLATGLFVGRTVGRRPGIYSAVVLASMPAWFLSGRLASHEMASLAAFAIVLAGIGLAVLDDTLPRLARIGAVLAASAASIVASPARGLVPIALVPAVAVVAAALLLDGTASWTSRLTAFVPAAAGFIHVGALPLTRLLLGPTASDNAHAAPFDSLVPLISYSLVPWTPLLPLAFASRPRSRGHLAVMLAAGLTLLVQSALASRSGPSSLLGVSALAGTIGVVLADLDGIRRPSAVACLVVVAIALLVTHDVNDLPRRVLVGLDLHGVTNEGTHLVEPARSLGLAIAVFGVVVVGLLSAPRPWLPFGRGVAVLFAGAMVGCLERFVAYPNILTRLSPGAAVEAWMNARHADESLGLLDVDSRVIPSRIADATTRFESAERAAAWLTEAPEVADSAPYPDAMVAERRWLAVGASQLPRLNAAFRALRGINVPIAAGADDTTLLASSATTNGPSRNPLDQVVLSDVPRFAHGVGATLGDRIDLVGWRLEDAHGREIDHARAGQNVHVRLILRVHSAEASTGAARALAGHCTFLHVERTPSRVALEHTEFAYPIDLWRDGDVIVDDFELKVPSTASGDGHTVYWGMGVLPCHDDRRMPITAGENDGHHRVPIGRIEVR